MRGTDEGSGSLFSNVDLAARIPAGYPLRTIRRVIVQGDLTQADGHAEWRAAPGMIHRHSPGSTRQLTPGADKGGRCGRFRR